MSSVPPSPAEREQDRSVGELLSAVTSDVQTLFRQEIDLAKAEVWQETTKAGKAAGMYGGAGLASYMVLLFLSLTAVLGLSNSAAAGPHR